MPESNLLKLGRYGLRDSTLILMVYRHGLRVSELVALSWEQVNFADGTIYINRLKHGVSYTHSLRGVKLRAWRKLQRDYLRIADSLFDLLLVTFVPNILRVLT